MGICSDRLAAFSWSSRLLLFAALAGISALRPQPLAAQTCGAWAGVTSWSGSFSLVGQGTGTDSSGNAVTANETLISTRLVLNPQAPCYWGAAASDTAATGSYTYSSSVDSCLASSFSGSGNATANGYLYFDSSGAIHFSPGGQLGGTSILGQCPGTSTMSFLSAAQLGGVLSPALPTPAASQELTGTRAFQESTTLGIPMSWTLNYDFTPSFTPLATSLSPVTAAAGGAAFTLTVNGTGFSNGVVAEWNGTPLATTFVSLTQLTALVPSSFIASAGTAMVTVVAGAFLLGSAPFTVNPPGQACNFSLTPASATMGAAGGSGAITVTATRTDCNWTPTSNASWITFPNNSATGTTNLSYTVAPNTAGTSRTATVSIGSQSFSVTQGGSTCTYSLPIASQAFAAYGGNGSVAVQAPPGCAWTASTGGVSWVVVTPPGGGSGDGAAGYSVLTNASTASRSATITVAGQPYTVIQAGTSATASCVASIPAAPQVALEGRTEVVGDVLLSCSGLTGAVTADISLSLNTNVTNALSGGITDAIVIINGSNSRNGAVAGYNSLAWPAVFIMPAADGTANVRISKVRADASILSTPGNPQAAAITGQISLHALPPIPVSAAQQTVANATPSMVFTEIQATPPTGGAQASLPLLFRKAAPASFQAMDTRLRVQVSNIPSTVQVYAPVFPDEGPTQAQLYSTDASGSGGSPVAGSSLAGGVFQQLTVTQGVATATWPVLAADPTAVETWTFPLAVLNAASGDLNQMLVSGTLAPVSDVSEPSATAPVPRYKDLSTPQKLVNLRIQTSLQPPETATATSTVLTGSVVTFGSVVINDTSDPAQTATNVVIRDNLPSGLTLVSCAVSGGVSSGVSCSGSGNQVLVNYGSLGPGQSATVTLVAQIDPSLPAGTVLENAVTASSDQVNQDLFAATASTSFTLMAGTPGAIADIPAAGTGNSQSFTFQFADPGGYQYLGVVNVLINSVLDGRNACYLAYLVPSSTLVLVDDAGDAGGPYAGSVTLGSSSSIQNSQCAVTLTSASGSGTTLSLTLSITFKPAFGGDRVTYVAARDLGSGNSNWQPLGVWQVPSAPSGPIAVSGIAPARGAGPAGTAVTFTLTVTDTRGAGDLGIVNLLINASIDGRLACYLAYVASSNSLILTGDSGDPGGSYAGSMTLNGGTAGIANSQCSVNGSGSSAAPSGNSLALTLNLTFQPGFAGNRVLYAAGRDGQGGNNTGWQPVGTWTVQ